MTWPNRPPTIFLPAIASALFSVWTMPLPAQVAVQAVSEDVLREYAGTYKWGRDAFLYLQLWNEFAGTNQLVAFDESGEVRTLYPTARDRFFSGPAAAVRSSVESSIEFSRDRAGRITSLKWQHEGG